MYGTHQLTRWNSNDYFHRHVWKASSQMLKARPHVQKEVNHLSFRDRSLVQRNQQNKRPYHRNWHASVVYRLTLGSTSGSLKGGMLQSQVGMWMNNDAKWEVIDNMFTNTTQLTQSCGLSILTLLFCICLKKLHLPNIVSKDARRNFLQETAKIVS